VGVDKQAVLERIHREWLGIIMRGESAAETLSTCEAIIEGGARLVEVAFTTPDICNVMTELRRRHGDRIVLFAGTVRTAEEAQIAIDSGADAVVSPNLYPPVVEMTLRNGRVSVPGCVTPTEIAEALRIGADIIKLFPCYPAGPDYIRYIRAPIPEARLLPAGAVTYDNMHEYYAAGAFAAVVGVTTEMRLSEAVKNRRWDEIATATRVHLARVAEFRNGGHE